MARRKSQMSAKGLKSLYNPLNFAPPSRDYVCQLREAANVSQAEAARAIGFERAKANITWYRFEAGTTAKQKATPTRFQYIALFNILVLDDDVRNWRAGLVGGQIHAAAFMRKSNKAPLELARAVPAKYRRACDHNPLNYVPPAASQIRKAREKANLSIAQAADVIGVCRRAWQNYEYGFAVAGGKKVAKTMPFHDWALFNILALDDAPANWRAGLPSPKTPYVHTGFRTIPLRDNSKAATKYNLKRYRAWREAKHGGQGKRKAA